MSPPPPLEEDDRKSKRAKHSESGLVFTNVNNSRGFAEIQSNHNEESEYIVSKFWEYFFLCVETPRPSTNFDGNDKPSRLDEIRGKLRHVASSKGWQFIEDAAGNVMIRTSAVNGKRTPLLCLQAHLDVVCSKNK
mmetsp:Transcript_16468/g.29108  ORF Transcript_16468/g.29108 Transcript_16468/m.29108 type:complete len:135 (+) Transcript_16468:37-441(+)